AESLRPVIDRHMDVVAAHTELDNAAEFDAAAAGAQMAVVLGGDGTILRSARLMGYNQLPVVGVNLGKLGFLAAVAPTRLDESLRSVAAGNYRVVDHLMFTCELYPRDATADTPPTHKRLGLNELAVQAGAPFRMLSAQLYVDGDLVATYECDGLIISTPVGSTAHNLAAGGPILRKSLQAFVVSPLNPHTLTNRPVVDTADRVYEIVVPSPNEGTSLLVDGQVVAPLAPGDRVRFRRSAASFQLVEATGQSYYRTLRNKLGWQRRPREEKPDDES
ncbi:MAG: NAD(+)/NADH kinase, partial [Planctomycetota bacterium]